MNMADITTGNGVVPFMNVGSNDGFGNGSWFWIIILLFFFWGGNNNNNDVARESTVNTQFMERDIQGVNSNVTSSAATLGTQILENKYAAALSASETQKDILLGNAGINQNILLGNQNMAASMASCCCELKQQASENTQKIIDTITNNRIADLTQELNLAQIVASNQTQTQTLLNNMGRWVPYAGYNSYSLYGTTLQ